MLSLFTSTIRRVLLINNQNRAHQAPEGSSSNTSQFMPPTRILIPKRDTGPSNPHLPVRAFERTKSFGHQQLTERIDLTRKQLGLREGGGAGKRVDSTMPAANVLSILEKVRKETGAKQGSVDQFLFWLAGAVDLTQRCCVLCLSSPQVLT